MPHFKSINTYQNKRYKNYNFVKLDMLESLDEIINYWTVINIEDRWYNYNEMMESDLLLYRDLCPTHKFCSISSLSGGPNFLVVFFIRLARHRLCKISQIMSYSTWKKVIDTNSTTMSFNMLCIYLVRFDFTNVVREKKKKN